MDVLVKLDTSKCSATARRLMDGIFLCYCHESKMASFRRVLFILTVLFSKITSKPVNKTGLSIKNKILLPKDHIPAVKLERDGHINPEFHHEAFLGRLVEEGKLNPSNVDGSKKLIEIFHKVDLNNNHKVDRQELAEWIHERIKEHYDHAIKVNSESFHKVDKNNDGILSLREYLQGLTQDDQAENDALKLGEQTGLIMVLDLWRVLVL
jgi:hypothetical protein